MSSCVDWPGLEINSWSNFVTRAQKLGGTHPHRLRYICRGHADGTWDLKPSLLRQFQSPNTADVALAIELDGLEEFQAQAHLHVAQSHLPSEALTNQIPEWWAVMQHYRAPTRLLDWTQSPYVAAYFAVESHPNDDGVVLVVDGKAILDHFKALHGTAEVMDGELQHPSAPPFVSVWRPRKRSERVVAQQGYFTFCLNVLESHDEALANACPGAGSPEDGPLRRWIIPAKLKPEFLRQLRVMNIASHSLFPGLDGLGRSVAEIARFGPFRIPGAP